MNGSLHYRSERGATLAASAVFMALLLGCAAMTVDMGMVYTKKQSLQNAVDAAAVAGASKLSRTNDTPAETCARTVATANGVDPDEANFKFVVCGPDFHISANQKIDAVFAKFLTQSVTDGHGKPVTDENGEVKKTQITSMSVSAYSVATLHGVNVVNSGLRPIGVDKNDITSVRAEDDLTMTTSKGGLTYQPLVLPGASHRSLSDEIFKGDTDPVKVGDIVVKAKSYGGSATDQGISQLLDYANKDPWNRQDAFSLTGDNPRIIPIAVCDYSVSPAVIVGFAGFYVTGSSNGNITGSFIKDIRPPDTDFDPGTPMSWDDAGLTSNNTLKIDAPTLKIAKLKPGK